MKQTFIAGPCVIESAELLDTVAKKIVEINKFYLLTSICPTIIYVLSMTENNILRK